MSVNKLAAVGACIVVGVSIAVGLYVSGSPAEQRLIRLDTQRLADLQTIVHAMDLYKHDHEVLPAALADLVDGRRLSRLPTDPVTGIPYDYEIQSATRYTLCAQFDRASGGGKTDDFWAHGQGQKCYVLNVPD